MEKIKKIIKKHLILIIFIICILFSLIFGNIDESNKNSYGISISLIGILIVIVIFFILDKMKKLNRNNITYLIYGILLFMYLGYILNTNCGTRQHDTRNLNWENGGHFGYIDYILKNWKLPNVNPKDYWCFANPPLFYFISAVFIKIQNILGRVEYQAIENLQFLSVFYIMTFIVYLNKILEGLNIEKTRNYILMFIGLSPTVIYLTGSINNDSLALALSTMAIYYTIDWYKNSKFSSLLKNALSISLSIMTKINSAIIAIPIGIVFLIKLINEKEKFKKYIVYYLIFGLIALPIGLWFPIKNLIKYDIPITYVQTVVEGEQHDAYIGEYSIWQRFLGVSTHNLESINLSFEKEKADYNIFLSTLKSFIVDEQIDFSENLILKVSSYILFGVAIIIFIIFIISLININKREILNIFLILIFIFEAIFYIKFCLDYPYTFTMNFRYIVPMLLVSLAIIGLYAENNKKVNNLTQNLMFIFALFSIIFFLNIYI